jgi:hypothetical protein
LPNDLLLNAGLCCTRLCSSGVCGSSANVCGSWSDLCCWPGMRGRAKLLRGQQWLLQKALLWLALARPVRTSPLLQAVVLRCRLCGPDLCCGSHLRS